VKPSVAALTAAAAVVAAAAAVAAGARMTVLVHCNVLLWPASRTDL
jgi:hypothetical protein